MLENLVGLVCLLAAIAAGLLIRRVGVVVKPGG